LVDKTGSGDAANKRDNPVTEVKRNGDAVVLRLVGELDLYNAHAVRSALLSSAAEQPGRVVVDLSAVDFVDSTVLGVLVEARSRLDDGRSLLLAAPGLETRRALEVSGLDRHFSLHESVEQALAAQLR
jgi:anti-sigma B factor antagonist